jgi:KamA family protein
VILSGGDPLTLADHKLASLTAQLADVPHITRVRIHSRLPVVLPERVDAGLLEWIASIRQRVTLVIHANHARELDGEVAQGLPRLADAGVTLLNQSVLLRGVNDSAAALQELSERLFAVRVLPYYLHLLDRVRGSSHFEVGEAHAAELLRSLARQLPGYLVPRLVREEAGAVHKTPIAW